MSRWLYQMGERHWPSENYRREVRDGQIIRWPTRKRMFASEAPAPGDVIVCLYAPSYCDVPGICGFGIIMAYLSKKRRFDWLPLPPTNALKRRPWWDERAIEIVDLIRAQSLRATMYHVPAVLDTDLRRGLFRWAQR